MRVFFVVVCVGLRTTGGDAFILLHTCAINVVLNAMVKVNQAAILLASPGQPRHQPANKAAKPSYSKVFTQR